MIIEIHQPEIEALIEQRMATGAFHDVEDVLIHALRSAPLPESAALAPSTGTGADLVAAMQSMPCKDTDIEPFRPHMPVREVAW